MLDGMDSAEGLPTRGLGQSLQRQDVQADRLLVERFGGRGTRPGRPSGRGAAIGSDRQVPALAVGRRIRRARPETPERSARQAWDEHGSEGIVTRRGLLDVPRTAARLV